MSYDYWKTHSVTEHEKLLKEINQRILNGERVDTRKELAHIFNEDTPEFQQQEQLDAQINEQISDKLRGQLTAEQYFKKREQIRLQILNADKLAEKEEQKEESRINGTCLVCGSKCRSKGAEWFCQKCHKRFRKR